MLVEMRCLLVNQILGVVRDVFLYLSLSLSLSLTVDLKLFFLRYDLILKKDLRFCNHLVRIKKSVSCSCRRVVTLGGLAL